MQSSKEQRQGVDWLQAVLASWHESRTVKAGDEERLGVKQAYEKCAKWTMFHESIALTRQKKLGNRIWPCA